MAKKQNTTQKVRKERPLTIQQERFCEEYVNCGDATEAYRMVYGQGNYTDKSLNETACKLKNTLKIITRVEEIRAERRANSKVLLEESNRILSAIARANPKHLFYRDPKSGKSKTRSPQQLSDETADAVSTMTNNRGVVSYKFHSKLKALEQLARQNGWNSETINNNMNDSNLFNRFGFDFDESDGE